jgi:uncharacterized membrane protein
MPFCAQCGSENQGAACPACGTPAEAGLAAGPPRNSATVTSSSAQLEDHIVSALCYGLWPLTGILFLVLEPYSRNRSVRFHAFQSILVFAALFAGFAALSWLAFLPGVGLLFSLITLLYPLFTFGLWALLIFKAYNKERFMVPVLGQLAETQA